jgi:hypothetical protein
MKQKEEENLEKYGVHRGEGIDSQGIRKKIAEGNLDRSEFAFMPESYYAAEGGRIGLAKGLSPRIAALRAMQGLNDDDEEKTKYAASGGRIGYRDGIGPNQGSPGIMSQATTDQEIEDAFGVSVDDAAIQKPRAGGGDVANMDMIALEFKQQHGYDMMLATPEVREFFIKQWMNQNFYDKSEAPGRDRAMAAEGGLMDLGGMEKDYRQEGGFVPIGGKEKADDVPARLSKNEFVFTADAVRAAGGGDIDQGAEVMENVMNNLEAGGEVSEDSQGLEGARGMFANTQQLEKRII